MSDPRKLSEQGERDRARYSAAMHAVQSAVAYEIQYAGEARAAANAKHLRVGVNACLVDSSAVAQLLIAKGVFTEDEYLAALAVAAEQEQARMTEHVRHITGLTNLTFG